MTSGDEIPGFTERYGGTTGDPPHAFSSFPVERNCVKVLSMRRYGITLLGAALTLFSLAAGVSSRVAVAQDPAPAEQKEVAKPMNPPSYAIGLNIGRNLKEAGFKPEDLSKEDLIAGIMDTLSGADSRLDDKEMAAAFEKINQMLTSRAEAATKDNLTKANTFLEDNKKKEGVIALPSGLQYKVVKQGAGAQPKLSSEVKVHYEGKLMNGTIFDSSIKRGEPAEFPVGGVIKGWTEALQRMKVGDKWILYVPPGLAYGERGAGGDIGPNELLIFEVELLEVKN